MKRIGVVCFLNILFLCAVGHAITVERFTLESPEPDVFVWNIRTAFNSTTGATLVTWHREKGNPAIHSIRGRMISSAGEPTGKTFKLAKGPNPLFAEVTYNPDDNEFLVVYANETNGTGRFEVFAQKLKATGKRSGKPLRISPASDHGENINNTLPKTIYDPASLSYFVMWRRYKLDPNVGIEDGLYGMVLNTDLTERKSPVLMMRLQGDFTNLLGPNVDRIGFHPTNGKLLIAGWSQSPNPGFSIQYFLSRADATLKKATTKFTKLKKGLSSGAAPFAELVFLPGNHAQGLFVEGTGVRKRSINAKGKPAGADSLFFTGAVETVPLEFPVTALATEGGRAETAAIAVDDSSMQTGSLWLQTADSSGGAVGQPFQLQSNLSIGAQPAISALPNPPATGFLYAVIYVDGVRDFPSIPGDSTSLVLLKVNTTP